MKKEPKIKVEEIHLIKIDVVSNKIDTAAFQKASKPEFGIGHHVMHNLKDERLKISLALNFRDASKYELLELHIDFHFHIEHLENFYELTDDNSPNFHVWMIATLLGISVSTARGILYEKLSANNVPNIIIPIISPQTLLQSKTKSA